MMKKKERNPVSEEKVKDFFENVISGKIEVFSEKTEIAKENTKKAQLIKH